MALGESDFFGFRLFRDLRRQTRRRQRRRRRRQIVVRRFGDARHRVGGREAFARSGHRNVHLGASSASLEAV